MKKYVVLALSALTMACSSNDPSPTLTGTQEALDEPTDDETKDTLQITATEPNSIIYAGYDESHTLRSFRVTGYGGLGVNLDASNQMVPYEFVPVVIEGGGSSDVQFSLESSQELCKQICEYSPA